GYGLRPGVSPYPDYSQPSHDQAYKVVRLLEQHHGVEEVMPPRMADLDRTGCGDVPNILDALLRTYISTQCNVDASNAALQSLRRVYGVRNGSPDWYAVLQGSPEQLRDALKSCGMQMMKARNILRTLRMVWDDEQERQTTPEADGDLSKGDRDHEKQYDNVMIGFLDYIHSVDDSYEAMEKMLQFPGMGIKVTACVALFSMGRPVFAVDTHVDRLCKYLGWVPDEKTAKPKLTAERVFAHCDVRLPGDTKYKLHQLFWKHGRECFRCKEKTTPASTEWSMVKCPIEHLVDR
ncbi:DNA glycosylase, partial [Teratosphaeria nubilosa]